jgi:hypothetical protein
MASITECDGCHIRIGDGGDERPLGMEGRTTGNYGLPPGVFHWCRGCAAIACKAVYASRPADAQSEEDLICEAMTEAQEHPGRIITR